MKNRRSIWSLVGDLPSFPSLKENTKADVCVIGGGIAGMTCAYLLSLEKKSVVVVDAGTVGGGETVRTTAHLTNAIDGGYRGIARLHGVEGARLAAQSHTAALRKIESIVMTEEIDCDFERLDGYLFMAPGQSPRVLERELDACYDAGIADVTHVEKVPLDFAQGSAIRFGMQAQFHPMKYLAGLTEAFVNRGGRVYERTRVTEVKGGSKARVTVSNGKKIDCAAVIVATNTPFNDWVVIHTKQAAYRTYAIGVRVPRGSVTRGLYWEETGSAGEPYHYLRVQRGTRGSDILIVGGEDHKTGQDDNSAERYVRLEEWTKERFPGLVSRAADFRWSGQVMETVDGLAFIGRNPSDHSNVYVATGFSGSGMTYGTISGLLLTDLVMGRKNEWEKLYEPSRKTLGSLLNFARENSNVLFQYAHWFTGGQVSSVGQIPPGCGAVLREGFDRLAVYRDESNVVHVRSAVCPHLGGIVNWNSAEKSWDCPCHGSRFDPLGKVINGPAVSHLPPAALPEGRSRNEDSLKNDRTKERNRS